MHSLEKMSEYREERNKYKKKKKKKVLNDLFIKDFGASTNTSKDKTVIFLPAFCLPKTQEFTFRAGLW